jgi:mannose-6-phosphate isomerase-like protein (cupin superfamily)
VTDDDLPRIVPKPWGHEVWFAHTDRYAGKILHVNAGQRLSVQYHERKDETSYLLSGRVVLSQGDDAERPDELTDREVGPGTVWRNEPGVVHAMRAIEDSVVLEASTPELDDIVRLSDSYGRVEQAERAQ